MLGHPPRVTVAELCEQRRGRIDDYPPYVVPVVAEMNDVVRAVLLFNRKAPVRTVFDQLNDLGCASGRRIRTVGKQLPNDRVARNSLNQLLEICRFDHEATGSAIWHC